MKKAFNLLVVCLILSVMVGCAKSDEDKAKDAAEQKAAELQKGLDKAMDK